MSSWKCICNLQVVVSNPVIVLLWLFTMLKSSYIQYSILCETELKWSQPTNLPVFCYCCPLSGWGFSSGETETCHSMLRDTRSAQMHSVQLHKHLHRKRCTSLQTNDYLVKARLHPDGLWVVLNYPRYSVKLMYPQRKQIILLPSFLLLPSFFLSWGSFDVYYVLEKVLSMIMFGFHTAAISMQSA